MKYPNSIFCNSLSCTSDCVLYRNSQYEHVMQHPVVLPCNHSYCLSCIAETISASSEYLCPLCRVSLDNQYIQVNSALNEVCEWFSEYKTVLYFLTWNVKNILPSRINSDASPPQTSIIYDKDEITNNSNNNNNNINNNVNNNNNNIKGDTNDNNNKTEHQQQQQPPLLPQQQSIDKLAGYKPRLNNSPLSLLHRDRPKYLEREAPLGNRAKLTMLTKETVRRPSIDDTTWATREGEPLEKWPDSPPLSPRYAYAPLIRPKEGWYIEPENATLEPPPCVVTDQQMTVCFYRDHFVSQSHYAFLGGTKEDPQFVAVESSQENKPITFKAMIRNKYGDYRTWISDTSGAKQIKKALKMEEKELEEVDSMDFKNEMVSWEERNVCSRFKFGVVYCRSGQTKEEEMFNNKDGSPLFEEFLDCFAEKIQTKGWGCFAGGLNVNSELDGVYTRFSFLGNYEIMFHVSTYLKYTQNDSQQLERKRHIGNDVVVLVFIEGQQALDPGFIRTQFNHVFIVVRPVTAADAQQTGALTAASDIPATDTTTSPREGSPRPSTPRKYYKIGVVAKRGVVPFGPYLQEKVYDSEELKNFLLPKLINAERAALHAPAFRDRMVRTRQLFLSTLLTSYTKIKSI